MINNEPFVLITNDDGINSVGLNKIKSYIKKYTSNLFIFAPQENCSGLGHSITLSKPLRIDKVYENTYSCDGTPTDCILLCLQEVLNGKKPDLIISGINMGANLGDDITYSGTVSAAMEGALLGINSVAFSIEVNNSSNKINWLGVEKYIDMILKKTFKDDIKKGNFLNINFPDCDDIGIKGIKVTKQARRKPGGIFIKKYDSNGLPYFMHTSKRSGTENYGTDVWAIKNKYISVTPLNVDLTSKISFDSFKKQFNERF